MTIRLTGISKMRTQRSLDGVKVQTSRDALRAGHQQPESTLSAPLMMLPRSRRSLLIKGLALAGPGRRPLRSLDIAVLAPELRTIWWARLWLMIALNIK